MSQRHMSESGTPGPNPGQRTRAQAPWLRVPAVRMLVHRFGWRAYALPFMAIVSFVVVLQPLIGSHASASAASAPSSSSPTSSAAYTSSAAKSSSAKSSPVSAPAAATPTITESAPIAPAAATPAVAVQVANAPACAGNAAAQLVLVSLSQQRAWMCQGTTQVNTTLVTSGEVDNGDQTPTGTWAVYSRETNRYLTGAGYSDYVNFWVPFNGDFGFHDATWQTMPFGSPNYVTQGSHGCVHLPTDVMSWLYNWVQVGAAVTVQA
jgi:lipoprotein-anchoring transpeptidase ErfK/SrfK